MVELDIPTDHAWEMVINAELRAQWQKTLRNFEVLETVNDQIEIVFYMIKVRLSSPYPDL